MPGTLVVDAKQSFSTVLFMGSEPRMRFGTLEQDISPEGLKKWSVSVAVSYITTPGQRAQSDVLNVTVTGPGADPGLSIPAGSQVELEGLRVGVSAPEQRDTGRIVGGKAWFQASNVRAVNGHRPAPEGGK